MNSQDHKPDPLIGREIGDCLIVGKLGQGSMGVVYKAKHKRLGRDVALKLLYASSPTQTPAALRGFENELRAAAALDHPNIVVIFDFGQEEEFYFVEMEFVDGESLNRRLEREHSMGVGDATRLLLESARACAAAHKRQIVHRDIKPGNIMLRTDGRVKVTDFGLAAGPAHAGQSASIALYLSPEQCAGNAVDARADVYSLGVTYYHMLTGVPPFTGDTALAVMLKHRALPIPDPRALKPGLPDVARTIIAKAMAKAPEERYQTCEEMIRDIQRGLSTLESAGKPNAARPQEKRLPARKAIAPTKPTAAKPVEPAEPTEKQTASGPRFGAMAALLVLGLVVGFAAVNGVRAMRARHVRKPAPRPPEMAKEGDHERAVQECDALLKRIEAQASNGAVKRDAPAAAKKLQQEQPPAAPRARGYAASGAFGLKVARRDRGLYNREPCWDVWVSARNESDSTAPIGPKDFALVLEGGRTLAPEEAFEAYHFTGGDVRPGKEVHGVLPFPLEGSEGKCLMYKREHRVPLESTPRR